MADFQTSLDLANRVYAWGWKASIIGATVTLVGVALLWWSTRVREAGFELRVATTNADAARANERAAELEVAAQRLKGELAWRRVSPEQRQILIDALRGQTITVWTAFVGTDPESMMFRADIDGALKEAGVTTKFFSGFTRALALAITNVPGKEYDALTNAFSKAGIPLVAVPPTLRQLQGELAIIVGTKPPPSFQIIP